MDEDTQTLDPPEADETELPLCECGCGGQVTGGLVFGRPRRYIRGHGPQAKTGTKPHQPAPPVGTTPSLDELKASAGDKAKAEDDRAPGKGTKAKRTRGRRPKDEGQVPPFRAGPIATGMNKMYARAGKIVKVMDPAIGEAILSTTRKEAEDDVTVGEAWEELAKTNPRIRAALLKMIQGGAWGQLIMAHAPIFLAVIMKDGIRKHIPFMKLIEAILSEDDTGEPSSVSVMMGGLTPEDAAQAMEFAQGLMSQMGFGMMARGPMPNMNGQRAATVPGEVVEDGADAA